MGWEEGGGLTEASADPWGAQMLGWLSRVVLHYMKGLGLEPLSLYVGGWPPGKRCDPGHGGSLQLRAVSREGRGL